MRKVYIISAFCILSASQTFAICEGVNLNDLKTKMENIIGESKLGEERKEFNEKITGRDRLCVVKLNEALKSSSNLNPTEKEIAELFSLIKSNFI